MGIDINNKYHKYSWGNECVSHPSYICGSYGYMESTAVYYSDLWLQSLYDISGTVLPCFGSDVTGRTQIVTVNDQS